MSTIDPTIKTSRVFDATLAVFDRLTELTMPAHPVLDETPPVFLFRDPDWEDREYVVVETNDDPATNDWIQSGPAASEERIVIDVTIRTLYPETDDVDDNLAVRRVIERLKALADVVQGIAWDPVTSKPKPIGFPNERTVGRRIDVQFVCAHTTQGVVGRALVRFALIGQI